MLNPNLEEDILKVTIAHEFFHTIQYSYFFGNILNENIWWLEATATLMEDEVYDSIDDYINYMNNFFNSSHKSFELYALDVRCLNFILCSHSLCHIICHDSCYTF